MASVAPQAEQINSGSVMKYYNWHPLVHSTHFGERLYFFLIRLQEPLHRPVADQIRDILQLADVRFACEYSVFGWWDALVRVWLSPVSCNRLLRVLNKKDLTNVDDFRGFTTTQIRYLWHGATDMLAHDKSTLAAIAEQYDNIEFTGKNPHHNDRDIWSRLQGAGLVFPRHVPNGDGNVKFYTSLERGSGTMSITEEIDAILYAMNSSEMASTASLYAGEGTMADYLVRCVANTYSDVLALAASFDIHLKKARLRPMTLLIANTDAMESDHINNIEPLSHIDETNLELLELEDNNALARLTACDREALNGLIVKVYKLSQGDPKLRKKLVRTILACIKNDYEELKGEISFLLDFEYTLVKYLQREFSASFGYNWPSVLKKMCEEDNHWKDHAENMAKPANKWSLGNYIYTALAARKKEEYNLRLERQLGTDWSQLLPKLPKLRNDLGHGRIYKLGHLEHFEGNVSEFLDEIMKAATLLARCTKALEDSGKV